MLFHNALFTGNDFNDWKKIIQTSYMGAKIKNAVSLDKKGRGVFHSTVVFMC